MQELYQKIYDTKYRHYGEQAFNHCPGVRLYPFYEKYILDGPMIDLGCGTGDLVKHLRINNHSLVHGYDWIKLDNCMDVWDITEPVPMENYDTCFCMDVIEHISDEKLYGLFDNMKKAKRQIFSISNTPSWIEMDGEKINSHINEKQFKVWNKIVNANFEIVMVKKIRDMQYLYITNKE